MTVAVLFNIFVGDALTTNSLSWAVTDLALTFPAEAEAKKKEAGLYEPKPEISHLFRCATLRMRGVEQVLVTVV
jgi:hypothetical protein